MFDVQKSIYFHCAERDCSGQEGYCLRQLFRGNGGGGTSGGQNEDPNGHGRGTTGVFGSSFFLRSDQTFRIDRSPKPCFLFSSGIISPFWTPTAMCAVTRSLLVDGGGMSATNPKGLWLKVSLDPLGPLVSE